MHACDGTHEARRGLKRFEAVPHFAAVGLQGLGLADDALLLDDALDDEDVLPSCRGVQIGTAAVFLSQFRDLLRIRIDGREAGRDVHALDLLGAGLDTLTGGGAREPDQEFGLDSLAGHLLQHAAGCKGMGRDDKHIGTRLLEGTGLNAEAGIGHQPVGRVIKEFLPACRNLCAEFRNAAFHPRESVTLGGLGDDLGIGSLGMALVGLCPAEHGLHVGMVLTQPREELIVHIGLVRRVAEGPLGNLGQTVAHRRIRQDGKLQARVVGIVHFFLEYAETGRRHARACRPHADQCLACRRNLSRNGDALFGVTGGIEIGKLYLCHDTIAHLDATRVIDDLDDGLQNGMRVDAEGTERSRLRPPAGELYGAFRRVPGGGDESHGSDDDAAKAEP